MHLEDYSLMKKKNNEMNYKELTGRENSYLVQTKDLYQIHPEALLELKKLQSAAREADIHIEVASAYRNFDKQLAIWNAKASGKRTLLTREEKILNFDTASNQEILEAIMAWSAIPGASRHHWGTEIDIYDKSVKPRDQLALTINECNEDFSKLYVWIDENLNRFKFHRPYKEDLGGVSVEPWHLSFTPISLQCEQHYTLDIFKQNIDESQLLFKDFVLEKIEEIYERYVINTSPA